MELEGKSVDRIAPNVFELGVVESSAGGRGFGISTSAGSAYHPYHQYQQNKVSSSQQQNNSSSNGSSGRNSRRRSLPPSPFTSTTPSSGAITTTTTTTEDQSNLLDTLRHPQPQHNHLKNSRKMRRYNKKLGKRLRRATQAAPNNNNEFLMQEHDPLYHLDVEHGTEEDSNSDEQNQDHHPDMHQHRVHRYSSSPEEDEEDFLTRDFSNAYEVVHAERLYSMSKNQLIHEYQLMEERVEFLENKLRSALLERESRKDMVKSDAIPVPMSTAMNSNRANDSLFSSTQSSLVEDEDEDRFQFICT
jgi:hypothetical protein